MGQGKVRWWSGRQVNVKWTSGECQVNLRWMSYLNLSLTFVDVKLVKIWISLKTYTLFWDWVLLFCSINSSCKCKHTFIHVKLFSIQENFITKFNLFFGPIVNLELVCINFWLITFFWPLFVIHCLFDKPETELDIIYKRIYSLLIKEKE